MIGVLPWVTPEGGVVEGIEPVVVGDHDVRVVVEQQGQHVVPFLGDRVVQGGVAFGILWEKR